MLIKFLRICTNRICVPVVHSLPCFYRNKQVLLNIASVFYLIAMLFASFFTSLVAFCVKIAVKIRTLYYVASFFALFLLFLHNNHTRFCRVTICNRTQDKIWHRDRPPRRIADKARLLRHLAPPLSVFRVSLRHMPQFFVQLRQWR